VSIPAFGQAYAQAYDFLYADKDYESECDLLEEVFRRFGTGANRSVLDLGCGTGGHAIPLARRGYQVVGIDRSGDMVAQAQRKAAEASGDFPSKPPSFAVSDLRCLDIRKRFDAAIMMFAVLGYQLENEDVSAALSAARRHIRAGGLVVGDVWYGPAVLRVGPSDRLRVLQPRSGEQLIRAASAELDALRHRCVVRYRLWHLRGAHLLERTEEDHEMRFFFPMELRYFLSQNGFQPLHLCAFPDLDRPLDEASWNALFCARTIGGEVDE
jgi:SAM-dependent methyltransferase